jgi:hypothetical protein
MNENSDNSTRKLLKKYVFKAIKATAKAVVFYLAYFFISSFLGPLSQVIPGFQQSVEAFVTVYICLIIISEMTAGTVYQYFFNVAKALFVILYMILALKGGIMGFNFQDVSIVVDLSFFFIVAMLLSLLGLARSVLQAINYLNQRVEAQQM